MEAARPRRSVHGPDQWGWGTIAVNKFSLGALADPTATGVTGRTVTLSHTTSGTIASSAIASLGQPLTSLLLPRLPLL